MNNHEILPDRASGGGVNKPNISRCWSSGGLGSTAPFGRNDLHFADFLAAFSVLLALIFTVFAPFTGARAQDAQPGIMVNGDLAVTGFSGTKQLGAQTFIDTDGVSLKIFDVSGRGSANSQVISAPAKFEAFARDIGQIFGVALDNAPQPNIYTTSTSAFGLQIVIPDNNADGVPERVNTGQPGATFMDGQFGTALGGGPGSVWRIDGVTGAISLFADIKLADMPNSGPGLGNIAFDPAHFQFYVSDRDTGFIHSLDLSGNELGTFDHGVQGRASAGLPQVVMNIADRMDITNPAFDSTDASTWHLADIKRRVWGLAYYSGRLYYGVDDGPQIWSVGINTNGDFANDARVEIQTVPGGKPVSDILFTPHGKMVLAQRGGNKGSQNYSEFHTPKDNSVLRYSRDETGMWVQIPEDYAIGFPVDHKNASGGVALTCEGTLWSTGDALRNDPAQAASLIPGGPLVVHGLQGNKMSLVRPFNAPPRASWFVDYDNQFADPEKAGHVGDVEVYRNCPGGHAESFPGWYPIPEWYPPEGWVPPVWWPETPDLDLEKTANTCVATPGQPGTFDCTYTIAVTNVSAADYVGQIHVDDNPPATAVYIPPPGGSIPWNCAQPGGAGTPITCDSTNIETLHPGETETLDITIQVTPPVGDNHVRNCAIVDDLFPWNNEDCGEADLPLPDLDLDKTFLGCVPEGLAQRCYFTITMENVGGAPYSGPLHFVENLPAGTIFGGIHISTTLGWGCVGGPPVECTLPDPPGVTLNPGDTDSVLISVIVPAGMSGDMENCVALGLPEHAGDPVAPGVNNYCEPFTVPAPPPPPPPPPPPLGPNPVIHNCPAGWTLVPPGGAPVGYQVIAIDGINPDGTGWGIMCMKPKPLPLAPNPIVHKCPAGWTKVPPGGAPAGYQVLAVDGINPDGTGWGIMCMKPKPQPPLLPNPPVHKCPAGWSKVPPQGLPAGYKMMHIDGINPDGSKWGLSCMKPKQVLVPFPLCKKGEKKYQSAGQVPKGWSSRKVTLGKVTIYCAKPRVFIPLPLCQKGEKTYSSKGQVPKGWTSRKVTLGNRTIYCAKPRVLRPGTYTPGLSRPITRPKCIGGKLLKLKTMPPRYICKCPSKWSNRNGTCKAPLSPTTRPTVRPKVKVIPNLQRKPKPRSRPNLQYKPKPKPKLNLQTLPNTKPVTRQNRSFRVQPMNRRTVIR